MVTDLRLGFYGDDFTGSTDALEALASAGLRTALFVAPPTDAQLARFGGLEAVGVAGCTRALAAAEMADELRPVFTRFAELGCRVVHYKTCSTFDSSPQVGSIGRAIDIGQEVFASPFVPLLVAAPALQRFCAFGNLFARSGLDSEVFRLDRHPTMREHPITPMDEADLRVHLGRQTGRAIGLFDVQMLARADRAAALTDLLGAGTEIALFDAMADADLRKIGALVWARAVPGRTLFAAGSSGVEYALCAHWGEGEAPKPAGGAEVARALVMSGSCSPVTERQIARALAAGFGEVAVDTAQLVTGGREAQAEVARLVAESGRVIATGKSPLLHTARGPEDGRIAATADRLRTMGYGEMDIKLKSGEIFGRMLGDILKALLAETGLRRACVAGGDTASYAARQMGVEALEMVGKMAPGSPLCRVVAGESAVDGTEIAFKGGQVGGDDFFTVVLKGRP